MELHSPIEENFRIIDRQKKALHNLGLKTIKDLLFYFPSRYESFAARKNISELIVGDKTTVYGKIIELKNNRSFKRRMSIAQITIGDYTGTISAVWFNQPYITSYLNMGDKVALTGKITNGKGGLYIANPTYEKISSYEALNEGEAILAIYPETRGITSRWMRFAVQKILNNIESFPAEHIPEEILQTYHLPNLKSSLIFIHTPQKLTDAEGARKRFSFEEIFFIQLNRLKERAEHDKLPSFKISLSEKEMSDFIATFPFKLTSAQNKAISNVLDDFQRPRPMSRLLEGDVGSGKTAVAVAACYAATKNGYQVAYMAPTEILAQQHFKSFIDYFSKLRLTTKIGLITSSECKKYPSKVSYETATHISKSQLLKWEENGEIPILIGTHSLIQDKVKFKNLGLVIIDEQHRFGTKQRAALVKTKSEKAPHLLSMTATPIPRTLALTIYGDLDLTLLDEMPKGRLQTKTDIIEPGERKNAYEMIRGKLKEGRQLYVICPRIQEPDEKKAMTLNTKTVKDEAKRLKAEVFPEFEIDILHGKMSPKEKEDTLNEFRENKIQILVATSVVEVGIDVPNATMIIIEGAERFGLAQLHQLRGRVMRSTYQPYCFIFTSESVQGEPERLKAFAKSKNGFELAEYDLQFRGPGELSGAKQWGVSDIGMEALKNIKMVEAARVESQKLLEKDPSLKKYPLLLERISKQSSLHFE